MFGVRGMAVVGATAADAPPAREKVSPAAPNTGTAFVTRFLFEACFTRGMVASSVPCEKCFHSTRAIVRLANAACKPCDAPCAHPSSEVQVHERGRRPPIQSPISVTHIVPHNLGGHIRNGRRFNARLVTRLSNNS